MTTTPLDPGTDPIVPDHAPDEPEPLADPDGPGDVPMEPVAPPTTEARPDLPPAQLR